MMTGFDLEAYLAERQRLVEAELKARLNSLPPEPAHLKEAMAYSLLAGGKRLRPILCLAGAELIGAEPGSVLPTACALEYIHTYSLIHDDLPAMDDDDLRRGRPTCHKVFGEGLAVLAGDALLTEAFALLTEQGRTHPAERVLRVIALIAEAAGQRGMVGGQAADLQAEGGGAFGIEEVEFIHARKTGALMTASLSSGAVLAGAGPEELAAVEAYGRKMGAGFQIVDDLLDIEGDAEVMGKPIGSDQAKGKATYPAAVGVGPAREKARLLIEEAKDALGGFGKQAEPLRALAEYIINRNR